MGVLEDLANQLGIGVTQLRDNLLANQQVNEQLSPNYLTVDSSGHTGANFTGHVHAQGLDLDAASSTTPPSQDRIRWLRPSDGVDVADLAAYLIGADSQATFTVYDAAATGIVQIILNRDTSSDANNQIRARVSNAAGSLALDHLLLDANGGSDWLLLADNTQSPAAIDFGMANLTYPGGTPTSNEPTIAHNLGRSPRIVLADFTAGDPDSIVGKTYCRNYTANNFSVFARHVANISAQTQAIAWVAMG